MTCVFAMHSVTIQPSHKTFHIRKKKWILIINTQSSLSAVIRIVVRLASLDTRRISNSDGDEMMTQRDVPIFSGRCLVVDVTNNAVLLRSNKSRSAHQ